MKNTCRVLSIMVMLALLAACKSAKTPESPSTSTPNQPPVVETVTANATPIGETIEPTPTAEVTQTPIVDGDVAAISEKILSNLGVEWQIEGYQGGIYNYVNETQGIRLTISEVTAESLNNNSFKGEIVAGEKSIKADILIKDGVPLTAIQERDMTPGREYAPIEIFSIEDNKLVSINMLPIWSEARYQTNENGVMTIVDYQNRVLFEYADGSWKNVKPEFYEMDAKTEYGDVREWIIIGPYVEDADSNAAYVTGALIGIEQSPRDERVYGYVRVWDEDGEEKLIIVETGDRYVQELQKKSPFPVDERLYDKKFIVLAQLNGDNAVAADYDKGYQLLGDYILRKYATKRVGLAVILENKVNCMSRYVEAMTRSKLVRIFMEERKNTGVWEDTIIDGVTIYSTGYDLSVSASTLEAVKIIIE